MPQVRVRRNDSIEEMSARELVPGDIVLLEVGNSVPADCRLLESFNLKVQEAALTGESESVSKHTDPLQQDKLPLGDQQNMVFMGTVVTYGHGLAVVTETGMNTELGRIARSLQSVETEQTPLQRRLAQLGRTLAVVAVGMRWGPLRLMGHQYQHHQSGKLLLLLTWNMNRLARSKPGLK